MENDININFNVISNPDMSLDVSSGASVDFGVSASGGDAGLSPSTAINVVKIGGGETYDGPYSCTPMNYSQTFETAEKYMIADFLVHTVPTREEQNTAGGITMIIGG